MNDLTAFQRDLLFVVAGHEKPHGLALKAEMDEYYEKEVHHGRLYPNLDTFADKGLIEKQPLDNRTNSYTLTSDGRQALNSRASWEEQYID